MKLHALTANLWGLPWPVSCDRVGRKARFAELLARIRPDVVGLQEVWWPWRARFPGVPLHVPLSWRDAGLAISGSLASDSRVDLVPFRHHRGADRLKRKGILHSVIRVGDVDLSVVVTHLQAGRRHAAIRFRQASALRALIERIKEPVLCMGDFNFYGADDGRSAELLVAAGLRDAALTTGSALPTFWSGDTAERFDRIYVRDGKSTSIADGVERPAQPVVRPRARVRRPRSERLTDGSLVLVIDAIPWAVAHEVWGEGHLPGFSEPVPCVSVFPSFTNVAVPALIGQILGTRPPGYEARYYHPPSGTIRGGLITAEVDRHLAQYRIRPVGPLGMVAGFLVPQLMARGEVLRLVNGFAKEGGHWLAYAAATDGVAHFSGREALTAAFRNVILRIVDARRTIEAEHGTAPAVVLTSDHGMAFGPLANVSGADVGEALEQAGFVRESPGPNGFFLPAMGEVAAGVCFVAPDRAVMAAHILARLDGIDIVIARRSEESALVVRGADEATLEWRDGRCRYLASPADPLSYAPLLAELQRGGAVDAQGFVDTDGLLTASLRHDYPDALHRIRRALTDLVDFPAPVVFSMRPGFTYGPRLTHVAAAILGGQVGTHGALSSEQSIGFLSVAGLPAPPPVVRAETALVPYRDLVIQGARSS